MPDILFATDFSPSSEAAGQFAGLYARRLGARLHLLHVLPAREPGPVPAHRLSDLARRIGASDDCVSEMVTGSAADEIVGYARRNGIALIVVGTHGRTGFSRALLGSVAERVMRHAPCPVLTVPANVPPTAGAVPWPAGERAWPEPERRWSWEGAPPAGPGEHCVVCTNPSKDLICESCRARIRGYALDRKLHEMRAGRMP
jgi:nucleotide-binding universal stress UspA family protein